MIEITAIVILIVIIIAYGTYSKTCSPTWCMKSKVKELEKRQTILEEN